ncbi:fucose permease [Sphaerochaeta pleomorpha str. Grapes]|uniref:Fucose permease n=1 Tax=Sphaerochaeta pleomorpha (strain ATCC BAA-1885 / DSM 22778 / Grapes) TaxID=158190 RepID=G8QQM2_SPHPG|nr:MFS transporter [Sphaerochaeta pleomorpha]AEV30952.1 fucose permease [Sphaerochaeta pleomorpha str. Grapes]
MALLVIIYLSFISLGLPDGVLGSAWPVMHVQLNLPLWSAGVIALVTSGGTVVSALSSAKVIRRYGTGKVTAVSVLMTAVSLLGYSFAPNLLTLLLLAVPLGLGAGSVDSALNNYVALHYKARHMSWLHSFWGLGASGGPAIISLVFTLGYGYRQGYRAISVAQFVLVALLFLSLPFWQGKKSENQGKEAKASVNPLSLQGVPFALLTFFFYCAMESSTGLWASTYLVQVKGIGVEQAALWGSLFFLGITVGRMASGFITFRVSNNTMILGGLTVCFVALLLFFSPFVHLSGIALVTFGLGCAPIFPCMIHETPRRFGAENSQAVIGLQMASAYVGSMIMPPLFGLMASTLGLEWMPLVQLVFTLAMVLCVTKLIRIAKQKAKR